MSRSAGLVGFLVLLAALVVGGFIAVDRLAGDDTLEVVVDKPELGNAAVVEMDLIERETFPGILRFADPRLISATTSGTVTGAPSAGDTYTQGDVVIEIDGLPVFAFWGERPMWRTIAERALDGTEIEGADVEQLERNLIELGYPTLREEEDELPTISAADQTFDEDTVRLIQDWRSDVGLPEADAVEFGRIVYLQEPVRITQVLAESGALVAPGVPLVRVAAPDQEVFVQLPVDKRDSVAVGDSVLVTLPDGFVASASVVEVGTVVTFLAESGDAPGVIDLKIRLDDPSLGVDFDQSPVDVEIVSNSVLGAMAVPVNSLLALAEGGYGVEVERGGVVSLIAVETGLFVDDMVEITGEVVVGDAVIVPR